MLQAGRMMKIKKSLLDFYSMKEKSEKTAWITAYDYPTASFAEKAGMDMILVGDSLGMIVYGYESTVPVTMEECLMHCRAVRRGAPNTFVVGDMPFGSYHESDNDAVHNAVRFLKESGMDAVKLEGGQRVSSRIKAITDAGIAVIGHIGLTPQSSGVLGGFKAQGRTVESAETLIKDALSIQEAGIKILLVEAVPPELTSALIKIVKVPVYAIGSGPADGQVLTSADMLGYYEAFTPRFVKKYADVAKVITEAFGKYVKDIKEDKFPEKKHTYPVLPKEKAKFKEMVSRYIKEKS